MNNTFGNTTELELLRVPIPEQTDSYSPVAHRDVILEIQEQLDRKNLIVSNKDYRFARDGQKLIGYFDINNGDPDMGFRFGFKNSYDKSMSLGMTAGSSIWICSNGMMSGDIQFVRKHTGTVLSEMKEKIISTIEQLETIYIKHKADKEVMEDRPLNVFRRNEMLGNLFFTKKIISPHQASEVKREIEEPTYPEFKDDNIWGMYNKITHAFKKSHPTKYIENHVSLHKTVMEEYV